MNELSKEPWPSHAKELKRTRYPIMMYERMREWINRIGWDRFFKKTAIEVSMKDIDGYFFGNEFARSDLRFGW